MKNPTSRLATLAFLGAVIFLASCSKNDVTKPKPVVTPSQSSLTIVADTIGTFTADVSAAAVVKDITVMIDNGAIGTVVITNMADIVSKTTATANIQFTSTYTLGTGIITITVTDNASQTATTTLSVDVTDHPPVTIAGSIGANNVSGTNEIHLTQATTWGPHLTYHVTCNVFVEPTGSLTLLEGTTVIVDGLYSFTVRGNFYSYGTATDSVVFTVPANKRTQANIFGGLWGGVLSSNTDGTNTFAANEMVVQYTRMEYTGMLGQAWQDIVLLGEVADTNTPEYALFFNNPTGTCVIQNSTFAYSVDVALQIDQGNILVSNNAFILNGNAGGEAIDIKVGTNGDIAYNLFYKTATNGLKYNAKGGSSELHVYNNTAVECGWRQTSHSDHGGSFNVESGGKGLLYNNLIVGCTRGVRFSAGKLADVAHLSDGYNFHYSNIIGPVGTDLFTPQFYPADGYIIHGTDGNGTPKSGVDVLFETAHDVAGAVGANDPLFVNFNVAAFNDAAALAAEEPANEGFPATFDFHLQASSPALSGGKTGFSPYNTAALSAGGKTYSSPAPSGYIGAFGTK